MNISDQVYAFYKSRELGEPELLREFIDEDVVWCEPVVDDHMGDLIGVDSVLNMITKAFEKTKGSFSLKVVKTIEVGNNCAANIAWTAKKNGKIITGNEMAIFTIESGKITYAKFLAQNITNDQKFWE